MLKLSNIFIYIIIELHFFQIKFILHKLNSHFLYLNIKLKFVEKILFTNFEVYVILELQLFLNNTQSSLVYRFEKTCMLWFFILMVVG